MAQMEVGYCAKVFYLIRNYAIMDTNYLDSPFRMNASGNKQYSKIKFVISYLMKNIPIYLILVFLTLQGILQSCKKDAKEKEEVPTLTTTAVTDITTTTATSGGNITSEGTASITARGVCWSTNADPSTSDSKTTDGEGIGQFVSNITGIKGGTTYHVRAYATNSVGTAYGDDITFITEGVSDVDGNVYNTVTIGTQVWMQENLKTTKYNDGTEIPNVTDGATWSTLSTGAYCWYNNNAATYKETFGALYNWYVTASNNPKNVCPTGWHVPTDAEWTTLTTYLGGETVAGGKLKETGTTHWLTPNTGATNSSGFTALPGGNRLNDGSFDYIGQYGQWWSSTEYSDNYGWSRDMGYYFRTLDRAYYLKSSGYSVRCLKD
jgi:uncharacterized protein (TIGR02145 family)